MGNAIILAIINNTAAPAFDYCAPLICSCLRSCFSAICNCFGSDRDQTNDVQGTEPLLSGKNSGVNDGQSSRVYMVYAKHLDIKHRNDTNCWILVRQSESRFDEVAELKNVCSLEISARINFRKLYPKTIYAAYIIFRTTPESIGLNITQVASVSVGEELLIQKDVCLRPTKDTPRDGSIGLPEVVDGWMELNLGQFECDNVTGDKEVVISIKETKDMTKEKKGLIIACIELRPI